MLICKSSVKIKAYNKITDILIIKIDIVYVPLCTNYMSVLGPTLIRY